MNEIEVAEHFKPVAPHTLRVTIAHLVLGSGATLLLSSPLLAADIEEVLVTDRLRDIYSLEQSTLSKYTEPLSDTPQSITTLTEQLLEDRAASSLNDALRNVPGITLGAGEFSWQGNNPTIRGFSSRNDMFLDGIRDFGMYDRDPFNLQSIEVLQGPSSMAFGRGSTGGIINQSSKTPLGEQLRSLHLNVGNADTRRITADINEPFTEAVSARLNLMKHKSGVPDRDGAKADRYGIAPSLSMELGSATELTLSYMKQSSENTPDYGLPWLGGAPADVDRSNYYGFETDFIDTDADISTARLDHAFSQNTRIQAQLRYADYQRHTRITEPLLVGNPAAQTPLEDIMVRRNVFRGESTERMLQGQVNLVSEFTTGDIEHALVAGVELGSESSAPGFGFGLDVPNTPLLDPVEEPFSSTGFAWRMISDSDADSVAGFVLDTLKLNEQWQVMGGLRWDRFEIDYRGQRFNDDGTPRGNEQILRTDIETSYRAAVVYKPVEAGTLYLGWGTSFNPSSEGLSFIDSGRNLTTGNAFLDPEKNRSVELGTKWELMSDTLFIDAALFHIVKSNARVPDPTTSGFNILAGKQTVTGASFNVSGRIYQRLAITGGYTWLDSEQASTTQLNVEPGTPLAYVAEHSWNLWVNYDATDRLQIAGGINYLDERLASITVPVKAVPDYWTVDAMVKYQATENLSFKFNLTNLTDESYFDQLHNWHVVPGPGFSSVFAVNLDY